MLHQYLPFSPTKQQAIALTQVETFLQSDSDFFILRGSAGTGKTSVVSAITSYLEKQEAHFKLAAPTARAAKVIGEKTTTFSQTIHSLIYIPEPIEDGKGIYFRRKTNANESFNVYIVDESSMISDKLDESSYFFAPRPLLTDFIDYAKQGNAKNKVIFIGDKFQLPPVKAESVALDEQYLSSRFNLKGEMFELTEVMRQNKDSYILQYATHLRDCIELGKSAKPLSINHTFSTPQRMVESYLEDVGSKSFNFATMLAFTNRDVYWLNQEARRQLGYNQTVLTKGEHVVLDRGWFGKQQWLANGESGIIKAVHSTEHYLGLDFTNIELEVTNHVGEVTTIQSKVLLNTLYHDKAKLSTTEETKLYQERMRVNPIFRESKNPSDDPYLGAMRLRYGYALTCHKAQGGEWDHLFLHPYHAPNDYRWLYTAITRARQEIFTYWSSYWRK